MYSRYRKEFLTRHFHHLFAQSIVDSKGKEHIILSARELAQVRAVN